MQVMTGSKREITLKEWDEQLDKAMKRLEDSKKCYQIFKDESSLGFLQEDIESLNKVVRNLKEVILFMNKNEIK